MSQTTSLNQLQSQQTNKSPLATLQGYFTTHKQQISAALPKHLNPDRMSRLALTAFSQNSALAKCDPKTIFSSIICASQLGLEPGVDGQCYLVPYKNTCTMVPGWKGYVDLVSRSGRGTVFTGVIYKDQEYTFTDGARRDLVIHNETDCEDPNDITHAYAIGWVKDAEMPIIELWRVSKIVKHRDRHNKVGKRHYSYTNFEMYARKIPLLQVIKYMPKSIELRDAMEMDVGATEGKSYDYIDGEFMPMDMEQSQEETEAKQKNEEPSPKKPAKQEVANTSNEDFE